MHFAITRSVYYKMAICENGEFFDGGFLENTKGVNTYLHELKKKNNLDMCCI